MYALLNLSGLSFCWFGIPRGNLPIAIIRGVLTPLVCLGVVAISSDVAANVRLPALFTSGAVLQRDTRVPMWGWADPGESVKVSIGDQHKSVRADASGRWRVDLDPLQAGGPFQVVVEGSNRIELDDVVIGDVWICSGQSNMEWPLSKVKDGDLEGSTANCPDIRLITVATNGTQEPLSDFTGAWERCTPKSAADFSAVGFLFGRAIQQHQQVPIGLIDNSYGGSTCEAWIRRDRLEGNPLYRDTLMEWDEKAASFVEARDLPKYQRELANWEQRAKENQDAGKDVPSGKPYYMNFITSQCRPSNLYNARLCPIKPYAIKGVIWYQGESNVDRAMQYREMFPLMVKGWRNDWEQGDFPFYWVQLADYLAESTTPGESEWAELRDAQTQSLKAIANAGQAVTIDLGEADDIHPGDKLGVAHRLARLALSKTYGARIASESPCFRSMHADGDSVFVKLKVSNGRIETFEGAPAKGFAIAGADRVWHLADATLIGDDEIRVQSSHVPAPVFIRYAWADNPNCNLYDSAGLPVTPFHVGPEMVEATN